MLNNTGLLSDSTVNNNINRTTLSESLQSQCDAAHWMFIKYPSSLILADTKQDIAFQISVLLFMNKRCTPVTVVWWIFWLSASGADKMMSAYHLAASSLLSALLIAISDSFRPPNWSHHLLCWHWFNLIHNKISISHYRTLLFCQYHSAKTASTHFA